MSAVYISKYIDELKFFSTADKETVRNRKKLSPFLKEEI